MQRKYIIGTGIIILVILVCFFALQPMKHTYQTLSTKSSANQRTPLPKEITVTLTKNGFSPKKIRIRVGSAVRWKNESGSQETVNSDNYPTNQLHKELNFGVFANHSSVVYTFTKPGIYGYHNQLHPNQKGKVIVIQ